MGHILVPIVDPVSGAQFRNSLLYCRLRSLNLLVSAPPTFRPAITVDLRERASRGKKSSRSFVDGFGFNDSTFLNPVLPASVSLMSEHGV